mmetsp:Transcript_77942/g.156008  ORF Transcript_77942/g.156008 Transcript_77942/m.156008 type:complete len:541 (+) Transcript_77942:72-1694(+)
MAYKTVDPQSLDMEQQRRKMNEVLAVYKAKIVKLEASSKKNAEFTVSAQTPKQIEDAMRAVATLRDDFKSSLKEADIRASELERENAALKERLNDAEEKVRQLQASGGGGGGGDGVPAVNLELHIEGLSRATNVLAEESSALAKSLQSSAAVAAEAEDDGRGEEQRGRAKELAAMHQRLLQLHVGFIMHTGESNEAKLEEHAEALGALSERDMELAWFWFRGAVAALGGALRGRTPMGNANTPSPAHLQQGGEDYDDDAVHVAWGGNGEDEEEGQEQGWTSEEDDETAGQQVQSLEPYMAHQPYWMHKSWDFPELEPFNSIARHTIDYCGPSDESNWVIPDVLLVGAFPGCPDDDENWELITSILSLGVTTFVCLQDEYSDDAPEEDWRYERNGAIRPYFRDVREMVKRVEEAPAEFPSIHITSSDLHFIHFPIIDCDIGEDDAVYGLAVDLVVRVARGEVIYLHCWGGHGRTGSLVCIMLHLMYGLSAKGAMERCQFVHDLRRVPMQVSSPQKPSQRNQVRRIVGALETVDAKLQSPRM